MKASVNYNSYEVKDDLGKLIREGDLVAMVSDGTKGLVVRGVNGQKTTGLGIEYEEGGHDWLDVFPNGTLHVYGHEESDK
ncbi:hypothetical protein [Lacticaseibacillus paracasei]|uniref:hypothetical protein n=1 Tax=Lacticaseibacillus paracasei TaxID=1597 RepID=UPI0031D7C2A8